MSIGNVFQVVTVLMSFAMIMANQAQAAIITIPDATGQTGDYTVNNLLTPTSGESSVYIVGTMTFVNAVDTSGSFDVVEINAGGDFDAYQWGHAFNSDDFGYFFPTPAANIDPAISVGQSFLTVLKIDQLSGDYSFFVNPDLSDSESANTPFFSRVGGPTGALSAAQFRGGNGSSDIVDYTGFAVYTGLDSPFAVPEPSTFGMGIVLATLGALFIGYRQRSKRIVS